MTASEINNILTRLKLPFPKATAGGGHYGELYAVFMNLIERVEQLEECHILLCVRCRRMRTHVRQTKKL